MRKQNLKPYTCCHCGHVFYIDPTQRLPLDLELDLDLDCPYGCGDSSSQDIDVEIEEVI